VTFIPLHELPEEKGRKPDSERGQDRYGFAFDGRENLAAAGAGFLLAIPYDPRGGGKGWSPRADAEKERKKKKSYRAVRRRRKTFL